MFRWKLSSHQAEQTDYRSNHPSNLLHQKRIKKAYQNLLKYSKSHHSVHLADPRRTQRAVQNLLTPINLRGSHQYRDGYKGNSLLQVVTHPSAQGTGELVTSPLEAGGQHVFSKRSFSTYFGGNTVGFFFFLLALVLLEPHLALLTSLRRDGCCNQAGKHYEHLPGE